MKAPMQRVGRQAHKLLMTQMKQRLVIALFVRCSSHGVFP
jgi:hypothetical protein